MIDYKDKIKKLLALAKSPEPEEAKAALLKARKLMAEHKLREEDCLEPEKLKVRKELVGVTCTKRLNSWMVTLSAVIAENYCCTAWRSRKHGMQTVEIGFIGLEDDFEVCVRIFKYAVDCVLTKCKDIRREGREIYTGKYLGKMCDSYGYGFSEGVAAAFREQTKENQQWGLVLVVPREVKLEADKMKTSLFKEIDGPQSLGEMQAAHDGYMDGKKFDPTHRLQSEKSCGGGKALNGTHREDDQWFITILAFTMQKGSKSFKPCRLSAR